MFSSRWAMLAVPGIGSITGDFCSNQMSRVIEIRPFRGGALALRKAFYRVNFPSLLRLKLGRADVIRRAVFSIPKERTRDIDCYGRIKQSVLVRVIREDCADIFPPLREGPLIVSGRPDTSEFMNTVVEVRCAVLPMMT
jgi:hypothetical protein